MGSFHTTHDWNGDRLLSGTIIEALATVSRKDPAEIGLLYTVIDPDALDALFRPLDGAPFWNDAGRVEFSFDGYWVTATANGEVSIREFRPPTRDQETTEAGFGPGLARLVREADANGVNVEGGWVSQDEADDRVWNIEIFEVR